MNLGADRNFPRHRRRILGDYRESPYLTCELPCVLVPLWFAKPAIAAQTVYTAQARAPSTPKVRPKIAKDLYRSGIPGAAATAEAFPDSALSFSAASFAVAPSPDRVAASSSASHASPFGSSSEYFLKESTASGNFLSCI